MPDIQEGQAYVEYKGQKFPIPEEYTKEQVAKTMANHFPELSNYELIAKKDDPRGFSIQPQTGKKG